MKIIKENHETLAICLSIIASMVGALIWINSQFADLRAEFADLKKELAVIKTVLIMKDIMPERLAAHQTPSEPQKHTP